MAVSVRETLAAGLRRENRRFAELVLDEDSEIETVETPFLSDGSIYFVEHFGASHPTAFYVGLLEDGEVVLLSDHADRFELFARRGGARIEAQDRAASYARIYLETTRSMDSLFYVVEAVEDLRFRPNLEPAEERRKQAVVEEYGPRLRITVETEVDEYLVTLWAVREQTLERHAFRIGHDGRVSDSIETIEEDLPLVYGG